MRRRQPGRFQMRLIGLITAIAFLPSLLATPALGQGDPNEGQRLAREYCAICHYIEPDGEFKLAPPSFAAISIYRSDNQIRNRIFYPPVHTGMRPQLGFTFSSDNVEHLVAYIRSLEMPTR